ncbi:DUF551 domain-containing protein [Klebsiella michiganensis]
MTKSTITREENVQAVFDLKAGYTLGLADVEILKRVARMALAAIDSEPVAWMHNNNNIGIPAITVSPKIGNYWMSEFKDVQPLYRHAQQPTVAGDGRAEFETWMLKRWGRERRDDDFAMGKFIYGEDYADSYTRCVWKAWSASRAAMLQHQPQNEQQNIPEIIPGWIPVGARMPERGVDVLACKVSPIGGYEEIETAQWHGGMKGNQPVFIIGADTIEPAFWMPLPAAPQEVPDGK